MSTQQVLPITEPALRIAALFNRRTTTPWAAKELKQYKVLYKAGCFTTLDDLTLIERYYLSERKKGEKGIQRRDLYTFLNNYGGELDRAKAWNENKRPPIKRYIETNGERPCTDEEFEAAGRLAREMVAALRAKLKPS